jgi:hypothetical protein
MGQATLRPGYGCDDSQRIGCIKRAGPAREGQARNTQIQEGKVKLMTDQCKHCTLRGDIKKCMAGECGIHENWHSKQLKEKIEILRIALLGIIEPPSDTQNGLKAMEVEIRVADAPDDVKIVLINAIHSLLDTMGIDSKTNSITRKGDGK